ncbi:MAG TPA: hypothetical protein VGZ48_03650 [Candidatus Acidoferrales bacterium]|jgi:hypothetical protein|nr:hypothetical protein [Candidatus Acidoferrales bacterium]
MSESKSAVADKPESRPASKNAIPPPGIRCTFTDVAGRQCRNLALRPTGSGASRTKSGFCLAHATEERMLHDAEAVAEEIIGNAPTLDTVVGVNNVLAKLFELTVSDRIPMRKAAILTYQASLLLHSVGGVKTEIQKHFKDEVWHDMIVDAIKTIDGTDEPDSEAESDSKPAPEPDSEPDSESDPVPEPANA